jgi:hypothetical protein
MSKQKKTESIDQRRIALLLDLDSMVMDYKLGNQPDDYTLNKIDSILLSSDLFGKLFPDEDSKRRNYFTHEGDIIPSLYESLKNVDEIKKVIMFNNKLSDIHQYVCEYVEKKGKFDANKNIELQEIVKVLKDPKLFSAIFSDKRKLDYKYDNNPSFKELCGMFMFKPKSGQRYTGPAKLLFEASIAMSRRLKELDPQKIGQTTINRERPPKINALPPIPEENEYPFGAPLSPRQQSSRHGRF